MSTKEQYLDAIEDTLRRSLGGYQAPEITNQARMQYALCGCDNEQFLATSERREYSGPVTVAHIVMDEAERQIGIYLDWADQGEAHPSHAADVGRLAYSYFKAKRAVEQAVTR